MRRKKVAILRWDARTLRRNCVWGWTSFTTMAWFRR